MQTTLRSTPLKTILFVSLCLAACAFFLLVPPGVARAQDANSIVRAVLFYSPTCPHCAQVVQQDLPPLFNQYGNQLEIIGLDISQPDGQALYSAAITAFQIPDERLGVPTLIVGDAVLVGSLEIPEQFPGLIERYLAQGGMDWPAIPGLAEAVAAAEAAAQNTTPAPAQTPTEEPQGNSPSLTMTDPHNLTWQEKFTRDLAGNTLSLFVLVGMLGALLWARASFFRAAPARVSSPSWLIPLLCGLGFVVAGYLSYVETAQVTAVCGPVGDCNTVQQSEYARLFGVLPIGTLGLIGYILILLAWLGMRYAGGSLADLAALSLLAMTTGGTLFSVYLTFLEPFVIGATCAWCLTSAVVMTILMLLSVEPGRRALVNLKRKGGREKRVARHS